MSSAVAQEPPDKRQKMDVDMGSAGAEAWDDDLDIILTQNMNQLDHLVASSCRPVETDTNMSPDAVEHSGFCLAPVNGSTSIVSAFSAGNSCLPAQSKPNSAAYSRSTSTSVAEGNNGRLVGRGSSHSRSADSLGVYSAAVIQPVKKSVSIIGAQQSRSGTSLIPPSACTSSSVRETNTTSAMPHNSSVAYCSENANMNKLPTALANTSSESGGIDISRIKEECDYYKMQVRLFRSMWFAVTE
jgi:hypothetical protein